MPNLTQSPPSGKSRASGGQHGPESGRPFAEVIASHTRSASPAVAFLQALDPIGWHNLVRLDPTGRRGPIGLTIPPGRWDLAERFVAEAAGRENVYFSVNEPKADAPDKKLEKQDIGAVRVVSADIDLPGANDEAAVAALQAKVGTALAELPDPTFLIDSGGGVQAHWRLDAKLPATPEAIGWAEDQARGIAHELGGDAIGNVDRIMRLPGTINVPDARKRAKGRIERPAAVIEATGTVHMPDALRAAVPPIPKGTGEALDRDKDIAARQAAFVEAWPDIAAAATFDELPEDLRARFTRAAARNPTLAALWHGDEPAGGDASGSGYRATLAKMLAGAGGFDAFDFAALARVWEFAVQAGHDRDERLTPRALARDWERCGRPFTAEAMVAQYFDAAAASAAGARDPGERGASLFLSDTSPNDPKLFDVLTIAELFDRPDPRFTIDRHVPENSLGFLYGAPGTGKSFLSLDWALHLAFGLPTWHGDPIVGAEGVVIYLAGEGASGFKTRVGAWLKAHRIPQGAAGRFGLIFQSVNFMQAGDVERLAATLRARCPGRVALVVVDTVSRAIPGADENLQADMSLFVAACGKLQAEFGATVLGVHHANAGGTMRGSSVLLGAGDFVFKLERARGATIGKLHCEKQKDAPDGWSENYRFDVVHVAEAQSSLVPMRCEMGDGATLTPAVSAAVLDAMEAAWAAGRPWGRTAQSRDRWAVQRMREEFGFERADAENLLSVWIGTGQIEEAVASRKNKSRGYHVIRTGAATEEGVFA